MKPSKIDVNLNILIEEMLRCTSIASRLLQTNVFPNFWDDVRQHYKELELEESSILVPSWQSDEEKKDIENIKRKIRDLLTRFNIPLEK